MTYDPYEQQTRAFQPPPQQYGGPNYGAWPAPQQPYPPQRRPVWPWLVLAAALVLLAGAGWAVYDRVIRTDSGIAACEALRDGKTTFNGKPQDDTPLTEAQYSELRKVFADSRYDDIRDHGTKLMDVVWQVSQLAEGGDEASMGVLAYMAPLTTHMTGLQSACADHGIIVQFPK